MKNNLNIPKEAEFSVVIPDTAYITGFILDIGGRQYDALIKDKNTALNEYKQVGFYLKALVLDHNSSRRQFTNHDLGLSILET